MLLVTNVLSLVTSMSLEYEKSAKNRHSGEGSKTWVFGGLEPVRQAPLFRAKKYFFQSSMLMC
jgi:hypothetical protein